MVSITASTRRAEQDHYYSNPRRGQSETLPPPAKSWQQINGCGFCVDMHGRDLKMAGETDEGLFAVAAWRESPYSTDAERAALAPAEAATRLSDRGDAVPDEVWEEGRQHFNEQELAHLVLDIGAINFWNRLNVTVRQPAGSVPR
jgi:alkylhydroperoxidase family enzyme